MQAVLGARKKPEFNEVAILDSRSYVWVGLRNKASEGRGGEGRRGEKNRLLEN